MPVHSSSTAERLELILNGRKPYAWAQIVALSRGTMDRVLRGHFPDPELLVPACRVENLSLTWWIDGTGSPYLVRTVLDDEEGRWLIEQITGDEPDTTILVAHCDGRFALVCCQRAEAVSVKLVAYSYWACTVVAGGVDSRTIEAVFAKRHAGQVISIQMDNAELRRIVGGRMGTHELIGTGVEFGGLAAARGKTITSPAAITYTAHQRVRQRRVADAPPGSLIDKISELSDADREVLERMLDGLKR